MFQTCEIEKFDEILSENFPHLINLNWLLCFRDRKKKSNGEYLIGDLKALNPFMNYLSIDDGKPNGYDIVLTLDMSVFTNISEEDQKNFIKLLMKTVDYDEKIKIKKFSLLSVNEIEPHEIELYERLQLIAEQLYEESGQ